MINSMYIIKESNKLAYTKSVLLTFFENFMFPSSGKFSDAKSFRANKHFSECMYLNFCIGTFKVSLLYLLRNQSILLFISQRKKPKLINSSWIYL